MTVTELTPEILERVTPEAAQAELDRRAMPKAERGKADNRWAAQLWAPQLREILGGSATVTTTKVTTVTAPAPKPKPARKPAARKPQAPTGVAPTVVNPLTPIGSEAVSPDLSLPVADLAEALKAVEAPTKTRQSVLPTLKCVVIQAADGSATLTTTDLDTTMQVKVPATVTTPGAVAVPLAELKALLPGAKKNQVGDVRLHATDDTVAVTAGAVSSTVQCADLTQFPRLPDIAGDASPVITLDLDALASVVGSAASEDTRPILVGVLFDGNVIAATDSYRLAECESPTMKVEERILVPGKFLAGLVKRGRQAAAVTNGLDLLVTDEDGMVMTTRLIAGEFPNYKSLFPADADQLVSFDADEMVAALTAHLARKPGTTTPVRLMSGAGKFGVRITEADRFDATIEVKGSCPLTVGFNPRYLRDFVTGGFDQLHFVNALKPCIAEQTVGGRRQRRLLMPVRLS